MNMLNLLRHAGYARRIRFTTALFIICALFLSGCGRTPIIHYAITDLGVLPDGMESSASAINESGLVVGSSVLESGGYHAFISDGRTMTDLGVLPGMKYSSASAINNKGQIVGASFPESAIISHAFVYQGGKMRSLGMLSSGKSSASFSINDKGQIYGASDMASGPSHAFLYSAAKMIDLGPLPGGPNSHVTAINAAGQTVGQAQMASGASHAYLYNSGKVTDLGAMPEDYLSEARGINSKGQIVGLSMGQRTQPFRLTFTATHRLVPRTEFELHAVLFSPGSMKPTELGMLSGYISVANAINDHGQIVGNATTSDGVHHAALFHIGSTTPINLQTCLWPADQSRWTLIEATGINNKGQICGDGKINGQTHAFLLTPIPTKS